MKRSRIRAGSGVEAFEFSTPREEIVVEETTAGRFMVLVRGVQWGGKRGSDGAGDKTYATRVEAESVAALIE